jgi:hypothetical protein
MASLDASNLFLDCLNLKRITQRPFQVSGIIDYSKGPSISEDLKLQQPTGLERMLQLALWLLPL